MYRSKLCHHFVETVKEEPELAYCKVCKKSYNLWEIVEQPNQIPYKYWLDGRETWTNMP